MVIVLISYYSPYSSTVTYTSPGTVTIINIDCYTANVLFDSTDKDEIMVTSSIHAYYKELFDTISIDVQSSSDGKTLTITEKDTMDVSGQGLLKEISTKISIKIFLPISGQQKGEENSLDTYFAQNSRLSVNIKNGNLTANLSPSSEFGIGYVDITIQNAGSVVAKNFYCTSLKIETRNGSVWLNNFVLPTKGIAVINTMSGDVFIDNIVVAYGSSVQAQANMGNAYIKIAPELSCLKFKLIGSIKKPKIYEYGPSAYIINRTDLDPMTTEGTLLSEKCINTNISMTGNNVVLLLAQQSVLSW